MENLTKGFVYPISMAWVGTELILLAANGVTWPLLAGFALFITGFVVVGCYPLGDAAIDRAGRIFFSVFAFTCVLFSFKSFGTPLVGALKLIAATVLCFIVLRPTSAEKQSMDH